MKAPDLARRLQQALAGRYTICTELRGGGMSRVFRATDNASGADVVLKILPPELAAGVSVARFKREIDVAARLEHPHIVPLIATGYADELPWFAMPFLGGASLRERMGRSGPREDAVRILREMASALAYSHSRGVVHRDIKPENVLFAGSVSMITDFGVAKALVDAGDAFQTRGVARTKLTTRRIALGTPAYMSPEQAAGDPAVDTRADIYAWGVVAYEVLTGRPPFDGRSLIAQMAAHAHETPEAISNRRPSLPVTLSALVMRCLEKRPSDRPQRADALVAELDAVVGTLTESPRTSTVIVAVPVARPFGAMLNVRMVSLAAVLLLVMSVLLVVRLRH